MKLQKTEQTTSALSSGSVEVDDVLLSPIDELIKEFQRTDIFQFDIFFFFQAEDGIRDA